MGLAQPTPATPVALLVAAAAAPATAVPCPNTSAVFDVPVRKLQPGKSFGIKSGCVGSTPESRIAMGTDAEPVVSPQALAAWILARCHCEEKSGSLGVAPACAT